MKKLYIILTQSGTYFSKLLRFITKEKYNHSSICLNDDFQSFYSFGRKYPKFLIPGGFVIENAYKGVFGMFKEVPCFILEKEISDEQYKKLESRINHFQENSKRYHYGILSLMLADTTYSFVNKNKFFCSQFVAKLLNDIDISTPRVPEHTHPMDFTQIEGVKRLFEGDLKTFVKQI